MQPVIPLVALGTLAYVALALAVDAWMAKRHRRRVDEWRGWPDHFHLRGHR